jgi:hypothetical protein
LGAHHRGTTFVPATSAPAAPPASVGPNAHHVSSQFIPAGGPARTYTNAAPTHSSSTPPTGSTRHVASTFRPANVAPSHSPAPGAKHVSSSFRPA